MTISGPSKPRPHLVRFRGVPDGTSGGPPGETSKTSNDTIQEHSLITSLFCLVVFGSLSFGSSSSRRRREDFLSASRSRIISFLRPEVGLENSIRTSGRSRRTRSRRRSSQPSSVNRRRSILHIRSSTHRKTCAPPQPQRERECRTILIRPLDTSS